MKSKIRERFFLGGYEDALMVLQGDGDTEGITHVLSVTDAALGSDEMKSSVSRKLIPFTDNEFENLLERLEECLSFIDEALDGGGALLVHCTVGVSRSVSVVMAYLMRKEKLTAEAALREVKRLRPQASPNPGFVRQLKLFESLGCAIINTNTSMEYKVFRTKELRRAFNMANRLSSKHFAAVNVVVGEDPEEMKCSACNRVIADASNVVHKPSRECCGQRFVEPMQWMTESISDLDRDDGNLICVGCGNVLGEYSWDELPCSCGAILMPAFCLRLQTAP